MSGPAAPIQIAAEFEVSNPQTQFLGQVLPAPPDIIFRPGYSRAAKGSVSGNIYGTWAQVYQVVQSMQVVSTGGGVCRIGFDPNDPSNPGTPSTCTIPAGSYTMPQNTEFFLMAQSGGGNATVAIASGASFQNNWFPTLRAANPVQAPLLTTLSSTTSPFNFTSGTHYVEIYGCSVGNGSVPLIDVRGSAILSIFGFSAILDSNTAKSSDDTGFVEALVVSNSFILSGALDAAPRSSVTYDDSSDVDSEYANNGAFDHRLSFAVRVFYDNTTSGLSAHNVQAAIDLLATGSGGGGSTYQFVVRPGYTGLEAGIYTTLADAITAANVIVTVAEGGPIVQFVFDGSDPSNPTPGIVHVESASYDPPPTYEFISIDYTQVVFDDGADFGSSAPSKLYGFGAGDGYASFTKGAGTTSVFQLSDGAERGIEMLNVLVAGDVASKTPLFDLTSGSELDLTAQVSCVLDAYAIGSSDNSGVSNALVTNLSSVTALAYSDDSAAMSGFTIYIDSSGTVDSTYLYATAFIDDAKYVNYSPADPANWSVVPSEVAQALDELAEGGGNGPIYTTTRTTSGKLSRPHSGWAIQPVGTAGAPVTITAWDSAVEGDCIELPDADGTYGVNALTFNGNGHNVQDPYNPNAALASTWVSQAGQKSPKPGWILSKTSTGTLYWMQMRST